MSDNPNQITIDNSVLIFIDHQPWVAFSVESIDAGLLVNNLAGLAASARTLDVPTILTTVGAKGLLNDPRSRAWRTPSRTSPRSTEPRQTPGRTFVKPSRQPAARRC